MTQAVALSLHAQITEALDELRQARADYDYSPNADRANTIEYAERRLDRLTDRLLAEPKTQA